MYGNIHACVPTYIVMRRLDTQKAGNSNCESVLCVLLTRNLLSSVNVLSEDFVFSLYPSHQEPCSYQCKRSMYVMCIRFKRGRLFVSLHYC